jgi:hypothetical protein
MAPRKQVRVLLPQTGSRSDYLRFAATKSLMTASGLWKSAIVLSMFHG